MSEWVYIWSDWYRWTVFDEIYGSAKKVIAGSFLGGLLMAASAHWLLAGIFIGIFITVLLGAIYFGRALSRHRRQRAVPTDQRAIATPTLQSAARMFDNPIVTAIEVNIRQLALPYPAGEEREKHLVGAYADMVY